MFEHHFADTCRVVFRETYPNKAAAVGGHLPSPVDMPTNVIKEALRRYNAGIKPVMHTPFFVDGADTARKQKVKRTITYV